MPLAAAAPRSMNLEGNMGRSEGATKVTGQFSLS